MPEYKLCLETEYRTSKEKLNADGADCMVIYTIHVFISYHQMKFLTTTIQLLISFGSNECSNCYKSFFGLLYITEMCEKSLFGFVEKHFWYL